MIDIRDLQLLTALAQHAHFGRAAAQCGISQPAFSMRIRNLEDRLGTSIVRRGNRYQGMTPEGEAIVERARHILDDVRSLEEEVHATTGEISGSLVLAVVPTAAAYAARLSGQLYERHPGIKVRIETATSIEIQLWIDEGRIDAGVTYGDGLSKDILDIQDLYSETYVLVSPTDMAPRQEGTATWAEAADLPLALLEPGMLNRRILDSTFSDAGLVPTVISETNALTTALVMAKDGQSATVMPSSLIEIFGPPEGTVTLPLTDPVLIKPMVLVTPNRGGTRPTVAALKRTAELLHDQI